MRVFLLLTAALALGSPVARAQTPAPERPAADIARDALRKPAQMVAFAHVAPGSTVVDMLPGGGYFTRVFAAAVGASGRVYAEVPSALSARKPSALSDIQALAAAPGYGMVKVISTLTEVTPGSADVVWTAQNYHDLPAQYRALLPTAAFAALRPGGYLVIVDHRARPGSGDADSATLHRIDPALVEKEAAAAGFVLDAQSDVLRNPDDPHDKIVFDPSIRGKTDQFALRFKKPG